MGYQILILKILGEIGIQLLVATGGVSFTKIWSSEKIEFYALDMSSFEKISSALENDPQVKLLLNFFELSKEQEEDLAKDIEASKGLIRVMVHPFYEDYYNITVFDEDNVERKKRKDNVLRMLRRLTESDSTKKPPVFIFEETGNYERGHLLEKLNELIESEIQDSLYVVPTLASEPTPSGSNESTTESDEPSEDERWADLIERYKKLGVKNIILGGMNLYVAKHNVEDAKSQDKLHECVGETAETLSPHFKVQISSATYPHNRSDLSTDKYK